MDDAGTLRSLAAAHECPGTHLVRTGREEGLKIEQSVGSTYQTGHTRLLQSYLGEKLLTLLIGVELGYLALGLRSHDEQLGILLLDGLAHCIDILVALGRRSVIDITNIHHRLGREQKQLAGKTLFVGSLERHRAGRLALLKSLLILLKHLILHLGHLVATGLSLLLSLGDAALDSLEVLELKLIVDNLLVAHGVDGIVNMGHIVIVKAAQHVEYGVSLADIGQKLVAQALALARALHQTGDVDNLHRSGNHRTGIAHLHEFVETVVGHRDHTHIGLNGAERKVGRLGLSV